MIFVLVIAQVPFVAFAEPAPLKCTMVNFAYPTDRFGRAWGLPDKNGLMTRWVAKRFGLDLTYEYILDNNKWDQMTLWAASGDYPECFVYQTHTAVFNTGSNIKWANLDKFYNNKNKYPRLYEIKQKYPRALLGITSPHGHIAGFPTRMNYKVGQPNPDQTYFGGWWIREDVLKAIGGKKPITLDDFTKMLRDIKAKNLKAPNGSSLIPLLLPPADWYSEAIMFYTFGLNWIGYSKTGWYQFWGITKQGHDAMKYLNQLYNENLIDPEWVTQKDEIFQEKKKNGSAAVIVGWINYTELADLKKCGYTYTAIPVPKIPGISHPNPWNLLLGPDSDIVLYLTSKANDARQERLANLAEWALSPEGCRYLYLGASPDMVELKTSGPYKGVYWFKDEYKALDWYANPDTTAARVKYGVLPLNGPQSYTRKDMKVPIINGEPEELSTANLIWIKANNNIDYMGDPGPEVISEETKPINNKIWSILPPMIQRACILPADQFEAAYQQVIEEAKKAEFKKLNDDQWVRRKAYLDKMGGFAGAGIPKDYMFADLYDEFK
jgi:hypothetical protein